MDVINNLVDSYHETKEYKDLDLVLDCGAANGSYHIGILLYLNSLEKKGCLKINRISGSSVGAITAIYYLTDSLQDLIDDYKKLRDCFKENLNLKVLKPLLKKQIDKFTPQTLEAVNNRLFIAYHDLQLNTQVIQKTYKNKKDLLEAVLKSSHLPILINEDIFFSDDDNNQYLS